MDFGTLVTSVEKLDQVFTENTVKAINRNLTARNWLTGFYIVNSNRTAATAPNMGTKPSKEWQSGCSLNLCRIEIYAYTDSFI